MMTHPGKLREEPEQVVVHGRVQYLCVVCEETIGTRSELDASGRCDRCRP